MSTKRYTVYNAAPRVGKELVDLSVKLFDSRILGVQHGVSYDPSVYSGQDLNNMWWPYKAKEV